MKESEEKKHFDEFSEWIKEDVMIYLNSKLELDKLKVNLVPGKLLSVHECFSLLAKDWFDNSQLPFLHHPILCRQNTSHHCGFHAFFNMACFLNIILASDSFVKLKYTYKMYSRFSYFYID